MDFNEGWLFKSYCTRKASLGRHFVSLYDWWLADMNGWNTFQTHWNVDLQATSSNITCYSGDRHEPLHYSGWHITSDCSAIVIKAVYYYGVSNFEFAAKTKKTPLLHLAFLINFFDFEFWTIGSTNFYSNFFDITFKSRSSILSKESFPNIALICWKFNKMSVHGIF